jgi:hypothetical protein
LSPSCLLIVSFLSPSCLLLLILIHLLVKEDLMRLFENENLEEDEEL